MAYQQISKNNNGGLKDLIMNRPPTVMFLLCLASCGLATMSISFYFNLSNKQVNIRKSNRRVYKVTLYNYDQL